MVSVGVREHFREGLRAKLELQLDNDEELICEALFGKMKDTSQLSQKLPPKGSSVIETPLQTLRALGVAYVVFDLVREDRGLALEVCHALSRQPTVRSPSEIRTLFENRVRKSSGQDSFVSGLVRAFQDERATLAESMLLEGVLAPIIAVSPDGESSKKVSRLRLPFPSKKQPRTPPPHSRTAKFLSSLLTTASVNPELLHAVKRSPLDEREGQSIRIQSLYAVICELERITDRDLLYLAQETPRGRGWGWKENGWSDLFEAIHQRTGRDLREHNKKFCTLDVVMLRAAISKVSEITDLKRYEDAFLQVAEVVRQVGSSDLPEGVRFAVVDQLRHEHQEKRAQLGFGKLAVSGN